jgi:hypothetical protein
MKSLNLQQKDAGNLADGTSNHIVYSAGKSRFPSDTQDQSV